MSAVQGWCWTAAIVAMVLAIPARAFHTLLLALIVLMLLPVALMVFL
jgi:hypothetical protein